jgi:hypothetical protein
MKTEDGFSTRAVHEGRGFAGTTGAVMPPVFEDWRRAIDQALPQVLQ